MENTKVVSLYLVQTTNWGIQDVIDDEKYALGFRVSYEEFEKNGLRIKHTEEGYYWTGWVGPYATLEQLIEDVDGEKSEE